MPQRKRLYVYIRVENSESYHYSGGKYLVQGLFRETENTPNRIKLKSCFIAVFGGVKKSNRILRQPRSHP